MLFPECKLFLLNKLHFVKRQSQTVEYNSYVTE